MSSEFHVMSQITGQACRATADGRPRLWISRAVLCGRTSPASPPVYHTAAPRTRCSWAARARMSTLQPAAGAAARPLPEPCAAALSLHAVALPDPASLQPCGDTRQGSVCQDICLFKWAPSSEHQAWQQLVPLRYLGDRQE